MRLVNVKWKYAGEWTPTLVLAEAGKSEKSSLAEIPLWNAFLKMQVGERFCSGYFQGAYHYACSNKPESGEYLCSSCAKKDEWLPCVKCRGSCINHQKREGCETADYIIYMAAFGNRTKVGVSRKYRFFPRILEQGADFAARLFDMQDGGYARQLEQKLSRKTGITDRVSGDFKIKRILTDPNESIAAMSESMARIEEKLKLNLPGVKIYDMRSFYRIQNVKEPPKPLQSDEICGKVLCVKGSIAVLQNDEVFSVNFRSLIGSEITVKASNALLQTPL
ncbi:MAG: DUF2797 domain-containing protein [Candidatus Aenigmarchaeota archaeon]|nr:DUF2797 domain-containing protein [Candidatus Aenigmarchaeota archaeon]